MTLPDIGELAGAIASIDWELDDAFLNERLQPVILRLAVKGVVDTFASMDDVDVALVTQALENAGDWASDYTFNLVKGINSTTRDLLAKKVAKFTLDTGITREQIIKELDPIFGAVRAEMITRTETMRALNEASKIAYKESGLFTKYRWRKTLEVDCPICVPLDGQEFIIGDEPDIPAHPRCNCVLVPVP